MPARDPKSPPTPTSADVDKVVDVFIADFILDGDPDYYWWWPRLVWTDPNEIIADDDEGGCYAVPFSSDDAGNVTFGDPREVRQVLIDVAQTAARVDGREAPAVAVFTARADRRLVNAGLPASRSDETGPIAPATQLEAERNSIIETAVREGKFSTSTGAFYRKQLALGGKTEAATRSLIEEFAAGVVAPTATPAAGGSSGTDPELHRQIMATFGVLDPRSAHDRGGSIHTELMTAFGVRSSEDPHDR